MGRIKNRDFLGLLDLRLIFGLLWKIGEFDLFGPQAVIEMKPHEEFTEEVSLDNNMT